jgi:CheY-like chemotaxis protein
MEQVILNLVINARDAMPEGGRITIRTANSDRCEGHDRPILPVTPGRFVQLAVSDTGMGIDPAVRPLIFEPFFTTKGARGTGLGLATVYAIVEQNGGHICLSSEIGKGTAFEVCFPRVEAERPVSKSRPSQAGMVRGSQTVLLVEDEEAVRGLVRQILLGAGYNVLESPDGAQALQLAEQHLGPIHLLVTDVVLPGVGGRMVAERLMALRPTMRILFLSGYTDDAVLRRGVDQADANFLQKPFTSADLLKKVAEILQ